MQRAEMRMYALAGAAVLGLYWYYQHKGIQAKPSAQVTNALDPAKYYAGRTTRDDPFPPGSKGGAGGGHDTAGVITPAGTQQPPSTVDSISKTAGEQAFKSLESRQ